MEHKRLLHYYDKNISEDITNGKNDDDLLSKHYYNINVNNGQCQIPPYINTTNRPTLLTFSNNRKKRKWDDLRTEPTSIPIIQRNESPTARCSNGMSSALRSEDVAYRRLHEHIDDDDDDDNYDSSSPEWNSFQKHSRSGSYKLIFLVGVLLFFLMMYIPVYNQANSRSTCGKNCSFSHTHINYASVASSWSRINTATNHTKMHAKNSIYKLKHIGFFEKLWSSARKGSVPGWSYNTSRDTRNYVLPDNVTLLNQPKSVCKLKQGDKNVYKNSHVNSNNKKKSSLSNEDNEIFLLVIVCSSMEHFEARSAIRETWGNQTNYELLAKKLQNVTKRFKTVNVTEKMLNDYSNTSNFLYIDKRIKRDLNYDNHYSDSERFDIDDGLYVNSTSTHTSENNRDNRELGMELLSGNIESNHSKISNVSLQSEVSVNRPDIRIVNTNKTNKNLKGNTLMNLDNVSKRTKRETKNEVKDSKNIEEVRFDYGDNAPDHSDATYADDGKILGNFEENDDNKNDIDFYDYQTEVSNIMKIPPRGQKDTESDNADDVKNHMKKILKLSVSGNKLKLESHTIKDLSSVKKNSSSNEIKNTSKTTQILKSTSDGSEAIVDNLIGSKDTSNFEPPVQIKFLFLLGQWSNENNTDLQSKIDEESAIYGDIIQEGFIDSYNNLTLKSVMLLKWVVSNCGDNVRYIMKTDDDMYINIPRLIDALKNKSNEYLKKVSKDVNIDSILKMNKTQKNALLKNERLLMGNLICDAKPISDTNSKWYSPTYMFGGKVYPRYLSGTGYVMSFGTAKVLYRAALDTPLFHLEDIYITGMCSMKSGIKPIDHPGFSYLVRKFNPCIYAYLITAHQVTPSQLRKMHNFLTDPSSNTLENCEIKHLLSMKNVSIISNVKDLLMKANNPLTLGSPKSFINGLVNLGMVDNNSRGSKLRTVKKRKRTNNGCF